MKVLMAFEIVKCGIFKFYKNVTIKFLKLMLGQLHRIQEITYEDISIVCNLNQGVNTL